jgi:hypothetical protein
VALPPLDDRPETRKAYRERTRWAAIALAAGIVSGTFFVVTITLFVSCEGDDCERNGYPALVAVLPGVLLWEAVVDLPREALLLRKPGQRQRVESWHAVVPRRAWWGPFPYRTTEPRWWLRLPDVEDGRLGIPVDERDAQRCAPDIHALVRGPLRRRGRVVLDFPDVILWPTGRIERIPDGV